MVVEESAGKEGGGGRDGRTEGQTGLASASGIEFALHALWLRFLLLVQGAWLGWGGIFFLLCLGACGWNEEKGSIDGSEKM